MLLSHLNAIQYSLLCCQYCRIWMCRATMNSVILSRNTRICKIGSIIFDNLVWLASFLRLVVRLWNWTVVYMVVAAELLTVLRIGERLPSPIWDDSRFLNVKNDVPGVFHWLGISTEISHKAVILGHLHCLPGGGHEIWVSDMKCLPLGVFQFSVQRLVYLWILATWLASLPRLVVYILKLTEMAINYFRWSLV